MLENDKKAQINQHMQGARIYIYFLRCETINVLPLMEMDSNYKQKSVDCGQILFMIRFD